MRYEDAHDPLAGGEQRGAPLLTGGEQRGHALLAHGMQRGEPLLAGGEQRGRHLLFGGEQRGFDTFAYMEGYAEHLAGSPHQAKNTRREPRKAA